MASSTPALQQSVPDVGAEMTGGRRFALSDYRGKKLVLYFYPKDGTPGCTAEGINFRDLYPRFQAAGAEIVGVSRDSLGSHESFKQKLDLPFELVSDSDESLCLMFGVMKSKTMYGKSVRGIDRTTFVIDACGKLVKEWRGLKVPGHVDDVLAYVQALA